MRDSAIIPVGVQRSRRTGRVSNLLKVTQLVMFRVEVFSDLSSQTTHDSSPN